MSTAAEIEERIRRSKMLATLEDHPGWQLIVTLLDAQIANNREALCQIGVNQTATEALRNDIRVMRWCRAGSLQATPELYAQWAKDLAFQRKKEKMREDLGFLQDENNHEDQQR